MDCCCPPTCVGGPAPPCKPPQSAVQEPARSALPPSLHRRPQATVDELKARFAELKPKYPPSRQRFTLPPREGARSGEALAHGKRLSDYGLTDGSVLFFKDLGPQVGGHGGQDLGAGRRLAGLTPSAAGPAAAAVAE